MGWRWRIKIFWQRTEAKAIENPVSKETRLGGRIRPWVYVEELGKYLRAVTLPDGTTLHNAFPDRRFTR